MTAPYIFFEDEAIIVIDKPPGIVVNNAETTTEETVEQWLVQEKKILALRGGIVHRLDKDTSGILLIGKSDDLVTKLQGQFASRTIEKKYTALVHGLLEEVSGTVAGNLGRNPKNRTKFAVLTEGRPAETTWQQQKTFFLSLEKIAALLPELNKNQRRYYTQHGQHYTLLRLTPKTGRTHQIRVHLTALRHPIVSDRVYTSRKLLRLDLMWCPRQFLHAEKLTFKHPATGESMTFVSEMPNDLQSALDYLESGIMNQESAEKHV